MKNDEAVLTLVREFNAPIELVFDACSTAEALSEWWGPIGFKMTSLRFEFKPKGIFLYKMENEEMLMWARFVYQEIKKPDLIEFILSFSDENGGITRAPFFDNWPLEIFNQLAFSEKDGKTTIRLTCYPVNASPEEITSFNTNKLSVNGGLSAAQDQLRIYLSERT